MTIQRVHQLLWVGLLVLIGVAACRSNRTIPLVPADYHSWQQPTQSLLNYPIPGHESHFRKIFINQIGMTVRITENNQRMFYDFPEGTIIVKEIYEGLEPPATDEPPLTLTVMIKQSDHPQARGGWLWVVKNINTQKEQIIDYELCVDCHANANEKHPYGDQNPRNAFRDFVFFPPRSSGTTPALPDTSSQTLSDYN